MRENIITSLLSTKYRHAKTGSIIMQYSVTYSPDDDMVIVVNEGPMNLEDTKNAAIETSKLLKEHNSRLVFLDCYNMELRHSLFEILDLPTFYESIGITNKVKSAYLINPNTPRQEKIDFYTTVCLNRGYRVKFFTDRDEAIGWLKSVVR